MDCSSSMRPRANSTIGGSKISFRRAGYKRVVEGDQQRAGFEHPLLLIDRVIKRASARDTLRDAARDPAGFQLRPRGAEDGRRRPELGQQLVGFACPQAGDQPQGEPVQFIFFSKGRRQHGFL